MRWHRVLEGFKPVSGEDIVHLNPLIPYAMQHEMLPRRYGIS